MAYGDSTLQTTPEAIARFRELVSKFRTAMFVTRGHDVALHGRPMAVAQVEEDGTLWFLTGLDTPKMSEITAHPDALVCMQNGNQFLTVNGHIEIVTDRSKVHELWNEAFRVWFNGKDDPDIVLLRVDPRMGEYWDQSGLRGLRYAFRAARAFLGRDKMDIGENEPELHAQVKLN